MLEGSLAAGRWLTLVQVNVMTLGQVNIARGKDIIALIDDGLDISGVVLRAAGRQRARQAGESSQGGEKEAGDLHIGHNKAVRLETGSRLRPVRTRMRCSEWARGLPYVPVL